MESVLGRYRNLIILVGVLFLQLLGLAVQVKRGADAENTRLIRIWAVDLITPFESGLVRVQDAGRGVWHNYFFLRGVRAENRELKEKIEKMRLDQVRLNEDAIQAHRLQSLLAFKEQFIAKTVPAQVIGSSGSDLSRSIYIDKGENAGLKPDMAVITAGGIVGKVWIVYPSTSLVLMINDQTSGVGAMLEKSRLQGVLRGTPEGAVVLERVMSDEQVVLGEAVLSSGGDQIFPKGLPVGTVSKVSPGKDMFLNIQVKPAADLSRLEEVLVVTEKQEQNAVVESGVRVRAADVLAQRLPSVPVKPATDAPATAAGASGDGEDVAPAPSMTPAVKLQISSAGSARPDAVQHAATPATTKVAIGASAAAPGGASTGTPAATQPPKKIVPKPASGDAALSAAPSAAGSNAASAPAKPAPPRPKPPVEQPNPTPPATEDDPH